MNKPKKPLRGLFASTEAPVHTPTKTPVLPPKPSKDAPRKPQTPNKPKLPPERVAPPPRVRPATPAMIMESSVAPVAPVAPVATVTPVAEATHPVPSVIQQNTFPVSEGEMRIMSVQYNFEAMREVRSSWIEHDYVKFLRRLEQLQTEAFILRGKLLSEAKERFFETNKLGWVQFCESHLGMNYTTANQYIRVANEFDVTSHHRPDFGFEHFKAMLPLSAEERIILIEAPESVSVKVLRSRVKEIIKSKPTNPTPLGTKQAQKQSQRFTRSLHNLKSEISGHGALFQTLPHAQRWQIAAVCQNIAAHLNQLARSLGDESNPELELRAHPLRAGAFGTAEGVALMENVLNTIDSSEIQSKN